MCCRNVLQKKVRALFLFLFALFLLTPSASHARDILVFDAQDFVKYKIPGVEDSRLTAVRTLRELFANVVRAGDVVYIVENWDAGGPGGNEEVDETWDTRGWDARFIVTEPIEISRDVEIYASCKGRKNSQGSIEFVGTTKEGDMKDDLTTFEGKGKSQIFVIKNGAKVTIANLRIHGAYNANSGGSAVAVTKGSDVTLKNCWIVNNTGGHIDGTGVYVNKSRLNIQNCDISRNKSEEGKGCAIALDEGSYAYIFNCTITSNDTHWRGFGGSWVDYYGDGGGIAVMGISSADIVSCDISRNTGNYGGGVHVKTYNAGGRSAGDGISSVTIKDCKISDNFCGYNHRGGGIDIDSAAAEITNCTISGNIVSGENWANTYGGGIHIYYPRDHVIITDCVITGNFANNSGGGVFTTGSFYTNNCSPVIKNCLISDNSATNLGGGIYVSGVYLAVDNCTITGNKTPGIEDDGYGREKGGGGGVCVGDAVLTMTNSTVTKNSTYYGAGGGGIYYIGTSWKENMLSNCTIVDNSARNGGIEIQRDGYVRASRIPFINSLIYNPTSPDRSFVNKDSERSMFFNCAIPESLTLPKTSPSFDIVQIASWSNPVSSTKKINGIEHTVYRIEDNPALKPIIGAGANRVIYSNEYYTPDVNYTSPSFDQIGTKRIESPDIGAVEKPQVAPVLSADVNINAVKDSAINTVTITDTEPNKLLTWTTSGDTPGGITVSSTKTSFTFEGSPSTAGDYVFAVTASNDKGSSTVTANMIVYEAPVFTDPEVSINAVENSEITARTITPEKGNHIVWTVSGDVPAGLDVLSDDTSITVSGTPTKAGDYVCTLTASNMAGSAELTVRITVYSAPALSDTAITVTAYEGEAITARTITAAGNHLTWTTRGTLPDGLTVLSRDSGFTVSGTPSAGSSGSYSYSITASNFAGSSSAVITVLVAARNYTVKPLVPAGLSAVLSGLTDYEIENIETLKLNENVTDLSGLDKLPNLIALDLTGATLLTSVDLRSNDTVLSLDISGNASITVLNIAGSKLENVYARSCVNLETVNAENCANLKILICPSCKISGLYLAGCSSLTTLNFTGNAIRKFNAKGFSALSTLECRSQIITDYNLKKSFDVSDFLSLAKVSPNDTAEGSSNVASVKGYDYEGREISCEYTSSAGTAIFATVPYKIEYNYMVSDDKSMDVTVWGEVELEKPSLSSTDVKISATEGTAITAVTITATPADYLKWSTSGSLPKGLSFDEGTDKFTVSGTPSAGTAGDYTYTVTASNPAGKANAVITVTVTAPDLPVDPESKTISPDTPSNLEEVISDMTSEQAAEVEEIAIGNNITSLTGIEKLTNLKSLDLSEASSLTEVNLNGNTSVKEVNLSGNTSVTTLNLSNSQVETVNAEGCDSLEEVNIEGNKTIKELRVSETKISSLNARDCENLEVLVCSSNRISTMNLEGCTNLRSLDFAGNAIRRFNAGGFTRLETLLCGGQQVRIQTFERVFNLLSFIMSAQASGFSASVADENKVLSVKGYDSSGKEISSQYDSKTGEVTFTKTPAKVTYDYDTGFEGKAMDVTISAESATPSITGTRSSSGGCNGSSVGTVLLMMILAYAFRFATAIKKQ